MTPWLETPIYGRNTRFSVEEVEGLTDEQLANLALYRGALAANIDSQHPDYCRDNQRLGDVWREQRNRRAA